MMKTIGESAFYACANLNGDLVVSDAVENIGNYAFNGCKNLLSGNILKLGKKLKYIGERAFDIDWETNSYFDKIYCSAPIPPSIDIRSYLYGWVLIVPQGCLNAYLDSNWTSVVTRFSSGPNIIEENF